MRVQLRDQFKKLPTSYDKALWLLLDDVVFLLTCIMRVHAHVCVCVFACVCVCLRVSKANCPSPTSSIPLARTGSQ